MGGDTFVVTFSFGDKPGVIRSQIGRHRPVGGLGGVVWVDVRWERATCTHMPESSVYMRVHSCVSLVGGVCVCVVCACSHAHVRGSCPSPRYNAGIVTGLTHSISYF